MSNSFKFYFFAAAVILLSSCNDDSVKSSEVVTIAASATTISADGKSTLKISGYIPIRALPDKRMITFRASKGSFAMGSGDSIRETASQVSNDKWRADVTFIAPLDSGQTKIFAITHGFKDSVTVTNEVVEASKIKLSADAFSVQVGFIGQLTLTGQLTSSVGGNVTKGRRVIITDVTALGLPVGGAFRNKQLRSNDASQVSAIYSPGLVTPGSFIYLKALVMDMNGKLTAKDSVKIYLTP